MNDTLLMVNSQQLEDGARSIALEPAVARRLTNGVPATWQQLERAAQILRDGPKTQITRASGSLSGTVDYDPHELPGFIDAERQEEDGVLVFDVGVLGHDSYRIARDGSLVNAESRKEHSS